MDKDQKIKAQQVRDDYLKQRAQRRAQEGLRPVEVVDVIPGDADGLLPVTANNSNIKLKIPDWGTTSIPGWPEKLVLEWKHDTEQDYTPLLTDNFTTPISETFPIQRDIPTRFFTRREGRFSFRYGAMSWSETQVSYSLDQPITIDRTPIYDQDDPPPVEDPGPVNDVVLNRDGGVILTIPDFVDDKKESVRIAVVWAFTPPPADLPIVPNFIIALPADRKVKVDRAIIEALPSGDHYVAYELFDKAGNRSRPSRLRDVKVALGDLPANLVAPVVPLAPGAGDTLIDLEDAHAGVYVEIPAFDFHHYADEVVVTWGLNEVPGVRVGTAVNPFPVEVPISWTHLKAEYTIDPNTQTTPVSYKVVRGTTDFPLDPPKAITVDVNFSYTGPENPDEPDPVNPDLGDVVVRGASGTPNHLIDTDNGQPATATIVVKSPTTGDLMTLYWNGVAVADTVTLGAEVEDDEVAIDITWAEIAAGPPGNVPVYYTLNNPLVENDQYSEDITVLVEAIPIEFDKVTFPDRVEVGGPVPILNCDALRKRKGTNDIGYRVMIPASEYLVAGEKIDLHWVLRKADGTTAIVGSDLDTMDETIPVDADINGMEWFITPYDPKIKLAYGEPSHFAYAEFFYTLTIGGTPIDSKFEHEVVGIYDTATGSACNLTSIPEFP